VNFAIMFDTHIDKWDLVRYAEELGYYSAYFPDSEMIWSDCYATMALAAVNTKRIRLGTGIAAPGVRIAPVTAHSIATINQIAPGRTFLGIGTGNTSMRVMGQNPTPLAELREYIRVVRGLLDGEEVDYTYRGKTRSIKFLHLDRHFINLKDRIPIHMAAYGPKALGLVGEKADGWITTGTEPEEVLGNFERIRNGAAGVGRPLPTDFPRAFVIAPAVLRPGEKLTDERIIDEIGSQVMCNMHAIYEDWELLGRKPEHIPPCFEDSWEEYGKRVASYPVATRYRHLHLGHCTFLQPEERRFVTEKAIRKFCYVGEPDELIERIRGMERAGMTELIVLVAADTQRKVYRDLAEYVMPAFR